MGADAWVYVDESQSPYATGTDSGQPFSVAALITESPIPASLVDDALAALRSDPDAANNPHDQATLRRGYFHASEDSKNAHSALCRAIANSGIVASLDVSLWHFDRKDGSERSGTALHRVSVLLSALGVLQDDYDAVHFVAALRDKTFDANVAAQFPNYIREQMLHSAASMPQLHARFPRISMRATDGSDPGVQVCDFVLWAVQRARLDRLTPKGNDDWVKRLGLRLFAAGGVEDAAGQHLDGELGTGCDRSILMPEDAPIPRAYSDLGNRDLWDATREIAIDVHRAALIARDHPRIGHLVDTLESASARCDIAASVPFEELLQIITDLMEAFLLVCDTLPVYDVTHGAEWTRATEKRIVAGAMLSGENVWLPKGFQLDRVALAPDARTGSV